MGTSSKAVKLRGQAGRRILSLLAVAALAVGGTFWYLRAQHTTAAPNPTELADTLKPASFVSNSAAGVAQFRKDIQPLLTTYCYDCHANGAKNGNVAFDQLASNDQILDPALWLKVIKNVRAGIMPPSDQPRPGSAEQQKLEAWIKACAFGSDPDNLDPGRVTLRRLNRTEYHNAIRDILGIDVDVSALPPDDVGYGFDNIGDVLSISPMRMEKFIEAAIAVVDQGVPKDTVAISGQSFLPREFVSEDGRNADHMSFYQVRTTSHTVKARVTGDYRIHIYCKIDGEEAPRDPQECRIHVTADGKEFFTKQYHYADNDWFDDPCIVHLDAGDHVISFTTEPVHPELRPLSTKMEYRVVMVRFEGPLERKLWVHPPGFDKLYTRDVPPTDPAERHTYAREVLGRFASNAFRRPVPEQTLSQLVALAEKTYSVSDVPFEAGIAQAVVAVLSSPRFLFHMEGTEGVATGETYPKIDEYSLAARLSFALWCSVPDEELTRLAAAGELRKNFPAQVKRMLADAKSQAFVENFSQQWLQTRAILDIPINSADVLAQETGTAAAAAPAAGAAAPAVAADVATADAAPGAEPQAAAGVARGGGRGFGRGAAAAAPDAPAIPPAGVAQAAEPATAAAGAAGGRGFGRGAGGAAGLGGRGAAGAGAGAGFGGRGGRGGRGGPVLNNGTELTPEVRTAMKQEVEAYFGYVVHEDRSVLEFLQSNYTFVNAALAPVYGVPNITGMEMRKVDLPADNPRGGFLTMGSVLSVTSNPTRTSPVKRGKWILENIFGAPTAPPPPNIPALEDSLNKLTGKKPTQREVLAIHREDAMCASCHARMDPLGLAMENFNAFGRFRSMEFAQPIDPSGQLITGEKFAGVTDLKQSLVKNHKLEYYRTLTGKLLTYVLGRGIEYYDVPTIDGIVEKVDKDDGKFSTLLMAVLESAPVQKCRPPAAVVAESATPTNKGG